MRYEFTEGRSSKFWEIVLEGRKFRVGWGRIGTAGQTQTKSFKTPDAARAAHDKLVAEKIKKGYRPSGTGSAAPKAKAKAKAEARDGTLSPALQKACARAGLRLDERTPIGGSFVVYQELPKTHRRYSISHQWDLSKRGWAWNDHAREFPGDTPARWFLEHVQGPEARALTWKDDDEARPLVIGSSGENEDLRGLRGRRVLYAFAYDPIGQFYVALELSDRAADPAVFRVDHEGPNLTGDEPFTTLSTFLRSVKPAPDVLAREAAPSRRVPFSGKLGPALLEQCRRLEIGLDGETALGFDGEFVVEVYEETRGNAWRATEETWEWRAHSAEFPPSASLLFLEKAFWSKRTFVFRSAKAVEISAVGTGAHCELRRQGKGALTLYRFMMEESSGAMLALDLRDPHTDPAVYRLGARAPIEGSERPISTLSGFLSRIMLRR
jgi:predicted DNA-binding WGR domain protein